MHKQFCEPGHGRDCYCLSMHAVQRSHLSLASAYSVAKSLSCHITATTARATQLMRGAYVLLACKCNVSWRHIALQHKMNCAARACPACCSTGCKLPVRRVLGPLGRPNISVPVAQCPSGLCACCTVLFSIWLGVGMAAQELLCVGCM